ncbi:hypothetical protein GCM10007147_43650 [Nocardiopsis kunsanensis]|uniref:Uncharacterized protein n=1 Tax=Nocardiopsis kunsanensis TaxID=141693 RepID=A0A918XLY5_9ACTN|nr:hypothetical protein GCM10007147_43650 [Nocardiopsis kunsanensis]
MVFLKAQVSSDLIGVGDHTYYDDRGSGVPFEEACVLYNYGPHRLFNGGFRAIAPGATILMPAGNHPTIGPSTYPFTMFGGQWAERTLETYLSAPAPPVCSTRAFGGQVLDGAGGPAREGGGHHAVHAGQGRQFQGQAP